MNAEGFSHLVCVCVRASPEESTEVDEYILVRDGKWEVQADSLESDYRHDGCNILE